MPTVSQRRSSQALHYPDLAAVAHASHVPTGLGAELPRLYGSLFATEPWFRIYDKAEPSGALELDDPRHVILYTIAGDTIEILNKAFPIAAADARRACLALFRAHPEARRIHLEVLCRPRELALPVRVLHEADDFVIDLPATPEDYKASLGKKTRKNIRNFGNVLRREHPDLCTTVADAGDDCRQLVEQFLEWHLARSRAHGVVSVYVSAPEQRDQLAELAAESGVVQVTRIEGRAAAIEFIFFVGAEATIYAGAFDPRYDHLGLLSTYWAVSETINRGARRCHLLWSTDYYKSLLGARPVHATRLSVFRSQVARLSSPGEAAQVARKRLRRGLTRYYWRSRHAARKALDRARPAGDRRSGRAKSDSPIGDTAPRQPTEEEHQCHDAHDVTTRRPSRPRSPWRRSRASNRSSRSPSASTSIPT